MSIPIPATRKSTDIPMPGRGVMVLATGATLFLVYWVYSLTISPLVWSSSIGLPSENGDNVEPQRPSQKNLDVAHEHLPHVKWAGDAKYQLHTTNSYVFAEEWKQADAKNGVRFKPFAMVWMQKGFKPGDTPITIIAESAYVRFASKFSLTSPSPGRVIAGSLEGKVEIRGPDGMRVWGRDFAFSEASMRMWSDAPVRFAHGPHHGRAHGIQCELLAPEGPRNPDRIAVAGIQSVRLLKDVVMNLVFEEGKRPDQRIQQVGGSKQVRMNGPSIKSKKKPTLVKILCDGNFRFGMQTNVATFEDNVRVFRPTKPNKFDVLMCDLLTLIFEPEESDAKTADSESDERFRGMSGKLAFRRLRAKVRSPERKVRLDSEENQLTTYSDDLIYDAQSKVAVLTDRTRVRVLQESSEMQSPKITLVQDAKGAVTSIWCQGAGWLKHYDKKTKQIDLAARWQLQLKKYPEPNSQLDLIELERDAIVLQPKDNSTLKAQFIRLWVDRRKKMRRTQTANEATQIAGSSGNEDRNRMKIRKMLALDEVTLVSPDMHANTRRLEVWFEYPPNEIDRRVPVSRTHLVPAVYCGTSSRRAAPSRTGQGFYAVNGPRLAATDGQTQSRSSENRTTRSATDGPMQISADKIQVRIQQVRSQLGRDDSQSTGKRDSRLKEVWVFGNVNVRQEHEPGEKPLIITGKKMHIVNRSKDDQLMHVFGEPAHVRDRGRHMEGENVNLDRGKNLSWINGPGLLQIPVDRDFEGKKLPEPKLLDVWWKKSMTFDGETAKFRGRVRTALADSRMRCGEMNVFLSERISFTERNRKKQAQIHSVVCSGIVDFDSYEYIGNKLMQIRKGRFVKFTLNQTTGDTLAEGPGHIQFWKRGDGKRGGFSPFATAKANAPAKTDKKDWEFTRIDFAGKSLGNSKQRFNTFHDRVRIVYGPVERPPHTIDADDLPKDGGWMRGKTLQVTQYEETKTRPAYVTLLARGNAELDGNKFHARADSISYDESKGLYLLRSLGTRKATIWRQQAVGAEPSRANAQHMEFIPAKNHLKLDRTTGLDGLR